MDDLLRKEIVGDWNNLKGTEYHLVYALWLLVCQRATSPILLRKRPVCDGPPQLAEPCDDSIPVRVCSEQRDIWVQVKCTHSPWTCTELLGENLLFNFVCNSYMSEGQGRMWDVRLVTPAEIRVKEIDQFRRSPDERPDLASKLDEIVQRVHVHLRKLRRRPESPATQFENEH